MCAMKKIIINVHFKGCVYYKVYTGWPKKNGTVDFSPCWIEHLFLIIITPRSSNLVENFLFYE